jgi:hypothetical protein
MDRTGKKRGNRVAGSRIGKDSAMLAAVPAENAMTFREGGGAFGSGLRKQGILKPVNRMAMTSPKGNPVF